jgi:cytosine/adenosine deaminase-related metal-dependent hydrolase
MIAVHGVAMNVQQAKAFRALIWCPESNFFLLNKTAEIDVLKQHTKILFGTDSTLSASWNFWHQLRFARSLSLLTNDELYKSCTTVAADVWRLKNTATIEEGNIADIVIAKRKNEVDIESFYLINPEDILLIIRHGKIKLFDKSLLAQLSHLPLSSFSKVYVSSAVKYVFGNLTELVKAIRNHNSNINLPIDIE